MLVVNVKNKKKYDVYIGRASKHNNYKRNILSNPYAIGEDGDRDEVIRKHAYQFIINWKTDLDFRNKVISLSGKKLGCFCAPKKCHGDTYVEFLNAFKMGGEKLALEVVRHISEGKEPPLYFNSKGLTSSYLSNFHPCNVYGYPSLENAYFASKCANTSDRVKYKNRTASSAKKLNRTIPVRSNWLDKLDSGIYFNEHVMKTLLLFKFSKNIDLKNKLLSTGDRKLIHYADWGSSSDTHWGVNSEGDGKDTLGKIMMEVRDIITKREINPKCVSLGHDILDSKSQVIAHGCNRQGKLGSGVAKSLVGRSPEIRKDYVDACREDKFQLGDIIKIKCDNGQWVVHMATQTFYGYKKDTPYASPKAIRSALEKVMSWCSAQGLRTLSIPLIGAGRGGLDSESVYKIIHSVHSGFKDKIDLTIFDFNADLNNEIRPTSESNGLNI